MDVAEAREYLKRIGAGSDGPHDIALAALMFAALDNPETKIEPYRAHLTELGEAARAEIEHTTDAELAGLGLGRVMRRRYGYDGGRKQYDDPRNADFIAVMQRRRGLPVALGILYMHAARAAGLGAQGLSSPGHFLLLVMTQDSEAVLDPYNGGTAVERDRLRGPPLLSEFGNPVERGGLEPVSDIDVLLRLQNNIKTRALQRRDSERAIAVVSRMLWIAPTRAALWLELGRLYEATGALGGARGAYEKCLGGGDDPSSKEARLALDSLKRRLN